MKKILLLIMCLYAGASAYAQMATTTEAGNDGNSRLISNDERKIHFHTKAKRLYADLNPATHNKTDINTPALNAEQVYYSYKANGFSMATIKSDDREGEAPLGGVTYNGKYHAPSCAYTFNKESQQGTFSFQNIRRGYAAVNLMDGLQGNITDYENFVIRTLGVTTPLAGQKITITTNNGNPTDVEQNARFSVQFCDINNNVLHEVVLYNDNVRVIPLKEFFTDDEIARINSVFLSTPAGDAYLCSDVTIAEAYFISAYDMNQEVYFHDMDNNYIGNAYLHPSYFILSNGVTMNETTGELASDRNIRTTTSLTDFNYNNQNATDAKIGESEGTVYGDAGVNDDNYADLSDYQWLTIRVEEGAAPRLLFNRVGDTGNDYLEVAGETPNNYLKSVETFSHDGKNEKIYVYDLAAVKSAKGSVHLNVIKGTNYGNLKVASMILEKPSQIAKGINARIQLSVPFSGFNMTDITVITFDNEEDGDLIWRNVYGYQDFKKNGANTGTKTIDLDKKNNFYQDIRTLYTSRYNADFHVIDPSLFIENNIDPVEGFNTYQKKVNNVYWDLKSFEDIDNKIQSGELTDRTMTVNDICFTKNHVVVRNGGNHTLLSKSLFNADVTEQLGVDLSGDSKFFLGDIAGSKYADLSKYYKMQIKGTPGKEIVIVANIPEDKGAWDGIYHETYVRLDSKGLANVDIAEIVANEGAYRLNFVSTPRGNTETIKLDYIKLYADEDGVVELNEDLYHSWNRPVNGTVTRLESYGGKTMDNGHLINNIGKVVKDGNMIFGHDYTFHKEDYAELTGYKKIKVTGTPGLSVRIVYNVSQNQIKDGDTEIQPCVFKDWTQPIGDNGTVEMDISEFVYFHLNGIKVGWGSSAGTVDKVELISDERVDYVLEGNGTLSTTVDEAKAYADGGKNGNIGTNAMDAINDVGARVIDARPRVSISRTALAYPANPNCLIIMRENLSKQQDHRRQFDTPTSEDGVAANMMTFDGLTRDDYKIGENKVDNLQLFDGFPFSAPRDFTVGTAKLTRKTTENVVGTLILPFACTDLNGTAYKTFGSEYAEHTTEKQGILGNVDINKGDHVLKFEATTSAAPYQPYLYVASATSDNTVFVSNSSKITKTPETYDEQIKLMTNNSAITSDETIDQNDLHYLRGFMESTHVENVYAYTAAGTLISAKNATMSPFRVLIQAPQDITTDRAPQAAATVKVVLASKFDDTDVTAIETVESINPESNVDVFSVNGALVKKNVKAADALQSLPKGVYVVGGKKIVK